MNRWELEQKIILRALKDPAFKKQLLHQPHEAVEEFLGKEKTLDIGFLGKINIRVVEEKKGEWIVAIPFVSGEKGTIPEEGMKWLAAGGTKHCGNIL